MTKADRLIAEFTDKIALDAVDAHRGAFTALAVDKGWTKARIGRYLGISRARVGQKVDKLEHYATLQGVPALKALMRHAATVKAERRDSDDLVRYDVGDWQNLDFARSLIDLVA